MSPSRSFYSWLIVAASIVAFVGGFALIGWYADADDEDAGPTPTVTATAPAETVTNQAPRRPARVVTETVEVPGPTVTVTQTAKPAPTVTVTETVTATPDETVLGASYPAPPMALNVDTAVSPGWKLERAARVWNRALGCKVFALTPSGTEGQIIYWVTETRGLTLDGVGVWALHSPPPTSTIEFDPSNYVRAYVAVHELGHALGLHHNHIPGSIMNVDAFDRQLPNKSDVSTALAAQVAAGRCAA